MVSIADDNEELIKAGNLCTELFESIVNIVGPEKGEEILKDMYRVIMDNVYDNPGIEILRRYQCGSESYRAAEATLEHFLDNLTVHTGHYSGINNEDSIKKANYMIEDNMNMLKWAAKELEDISDLIDF